MCYSDLVTWGYSKNQWGIVLGDVGFTAPPQLDSQSTGLLVGMLTPLSTSHPFPVLPARPHCLFEGPRALLFIFLSHSVEFLCWLCCLGSHYLNSGSLGFGRYIRLCCFPEGETNISMECSLNCFSKQRDKCVQNHSHTHHVPAGAHRALLRASYCGHETRRK